MTATCLPTPSTKALASNVQDDPFATAKGPDADWANLSTLMGAYADVQSTLAVLDYDLNQKVRVLIQEMAPAVGKAQIATAKLEEMMTAILERNPLLFAKAKSLKLPGGVIKLTSGVSLETEDEELTLHLIRGLYPDDADAYIRTKESPNKEALGTLDDDALARVKIARITKETFKFEPTKVDLGKAVAKLRQEQEAKES